MTRTFDVNSTLGFFRVSKRSLRPRGGRIVRVSFTLGNEAKVNVIVVNSRERVVRRLFGKRVGPGELTFSWDGRNNRGRYIAPGTYTLRVKAANELGRLVEERPVVLRR
jgi:flagellar hook assembly protein FlgD